MKGISSDARLPFRNMRATLGVCSRGPAFGPQPGGSAED